MRRFLLFSNALVVIVFAAVFAFTFWAREPMEHSARAALLADAQKRATPLVDSAEAALNSGLTQKLMTESQRATIQAEITEFRTHPTAVIEKIITSAGETAAVQVARDKASRFNPVLKKLEAWKHGLRDWYEKSLARLMIDVRVFARHQCHRRLPRVPHRLVCASRAV